MNSKCADRAVRGNRFTVKILRKIALSLNIPRAKSLRKADLCKQIHQLRPDIPLLPPPGFKDFDSKNLIDDLISYNQSLSDLGSALTEQGEINVTSLIKSFNKQQQKELEQERTILQQRRQLRDNQLQLDAKQKQLKDNQRKRKNTQSAEIESLKKAHQQELDAIHSLQEQEKTALIEAHRGEINELREEVQRLVENGGELQSAIEAAEETVEEERSRFQQDVAKLTTEHNEAIKRRNRDHAAEITALGNKNREQIARSIQQYTVQVEQLSANNAIFQAEIARLVASDKSGKALQIKQELRIKNWRQILQHVCQCTSKCSDKGDASWCFTNPTCPFAQQCRRGSHRKCNPVWENLAGSSRSKSKPDEFDNVGMEEFGIMTTNVAPKSTKLFRDKLRRKQKTKKTKGSH